MDNALHALCIGINKYDRSPLSGCVNDVLAVQDYFSSLCNRKGSSLEWKPRFLLAPTDAAEERRARERGVEKYAPPTRDNIIRSFEELASTPMRAGDVCLVYYSGHGSQEPAPPELAHLKPDGMNETMVCLDSRNPGGRDLLDKELAFLLLQIHKKNPAAHLVVIMDCCHSGNATRDHHHEVRARRESARSGFTPFQDLLGVRGIPPENRVFESIQVDGQTRAFYKNEARHILLSAARENELAKETSFNGEVRGAFTYCLLRVLQQDGSTGCNYLEILRRTESLVRNRVSAQIPQLDALGGARRDEGFLGGAVTAFRTEIPVLYENLTWKLKAGSLNGIVPGTPEIPTVVQLTDSRRVQVAQVFSNEAVLDNRSGILTKQDQENEEIRATIDRMGGPQIQIFIDGQQEKDLRSMATQLKPLYCHFDAAKTDAEYWASTDEKGFYMLIRKNSLYPVFLRQQLPQTFVQFCDAVGKWRFVQELEKSFFQGILPTDMDISLEILENVSRDTINAATGKKVSPDQVVLQQFDEKGKRKYPALRCSVKLNKPGYWIGGLYLDNEFGIFNFLETRENKAGMEHVFRFKDQGAEYNAMPLFIKPEWLQRGVSEITEYLKIFISNKDFKLADFEQASLPLDTQKALERAGFDSRSSEADPEWAVITIPIKIRANPAPVDLSSLQNDLVRVSGVRPGAAKGAWVCPAQVQEKFDQALLDRTTEAEFQQYLAPPDSLWGEVVADSQIFTRSLEVQPDKLFSILELTDLTDDLTEPFVLELTEKPNEDEVVIPYGFDLESFLYFPLGFTNADGNIEIIALPSETPGLLSDPHEELTRGGKGSIKLFFKKLFRRELPNTLALIRKDQPALTDEQAVKRAVENASSVLLVTHGIFGDTKDKIHAVMDATEIYRHFDVVLSFDFENLNTDMRVTARDLADRLERVGAFRPDLGPRLTIISPSTGGLVCRWMVEMESKAAPFVQRLVLVAVPNLGTELSDLRKRLFGLLGRALNGTAILKPYLIPLSFLAKKADNAFWRTLNDQAPGAGFLQELNNKGNKPDHIHYDMLGGTIEGLTMTNLNEGNFWKRFFKFWLKRALEKFAFDGPHDMCVEVASQQGARWLDRQKAVIIQGDHLSYFTGQAGQNALQKLLVKEPQA